MRPLLGGLGCAFPAADAGCDVAWSLPRLSHPFAGGAGRLKPADAHDAPSDGFLARPNRDFCASGHLVALLLEGVPGSRGEANNPCESSGLRGRSPLALSGFCKNRSGLAEHHRPLKGLPKRFHSLLRKNEVPVTRLSAPICWQTRLTKRKSELCPEKLRKRPSLSH